jgi:glycosyltransferase involved in cell wall biosynthesis
MSVSVVIPTTMRRETVAPVAEAAVASVSELPGGEVILVANGPAEGRRPLDFQSSRLRVLECRVPRPSAARNTGMREARNDVVLLTDDDCVISPDWVGRLTERLRNGEVAVTTPMKTRREGPVTSFLDYQRIFHPRPIDAGSVELALGACIGVRRDLIGFSFDDDLESGDDAQFVARLRDAGLTMAYEAEATPPLHLVEEGIESLAGRFFRYGTSSANTLLRKDRPEISIPYALPLYSSLSQGRIASPRRFEEIADPSLQQAFAAYELVLLGSLLIGYLDQAGRILDREIIHPNREGLDAGWLAIERRLQNDFAWDGDWRRLPIDFERLLAPRATTPPALAPDVAGNLAQHAPLVVEPGADPDLDQGGEVIGRRSEEVWIVVNELWGDLTDGRLPAEEEAIAQRLREGGVPFREGVQTMETIALGPVSAA